MLTNKNFIDDMNTKKLSIPEKKDFKKEFDKIVLEINKHTKNDCLFEVALVDKTGKIKLILNTGSIIFPHTYQEFQIMLNENKSQHKTLFSKGLEKHMDLFLVNLFFFNHAKEGISHVIQFDLEELEDKERLIMKYLY